jgi:hypothetical protein
MKKLVKENLSEAWGPDRGTENEMTPADYGAEAARKEGYDDNLYALLKVRWQQLSRRPEISVEAVGNKEEVESMKAKIEERNASRNYSVSYYLAIHKVKNDLTV